MTPARACARLFALLTAIGCASALPASAAVVISQVYGGGGNSGAPLNNDYVELYNNGTTAVDLSGWSVQYAAASGTTWGGAQLTPLSGSIAAGGYYLIQLGAGANAPAPLPTPDAVGTTAMSATAGKVALVNNTTALSGSCAVGGAVVDFVGFGSANCAEGTPAPAPSNTTAIIRTSGAGCLDTGDNSIDFITGAPSPHNRASPAQACGGGGQPGPIAARIFEIQGAAAQSPLAGKRVTTSGVVTLRTNNGFFMQDLAGDGNDATSDGIFVFTGSTAYPDAVRGNLVNVTATVAEFNTGAVPTAALPTPTLTQLTSVSSVSLQGTGYAITPINVRLPLARQSDLERYEGMLVTLAGPFTIAQNYFQGRYGQLTLGAGGRLETPTNRYRPGTSQVLALADENARRRIVLDDGSSLQNPNPTPYLDVASGLPRAGDNVGSITGVIDFGLSSSSNPGPGDYKIHPTVAPVFGTANPRTAAPALVGGNVKVASFNVLNFFTTFTDGNTADGQTGQGCTLGSQTSASNCRGANNLTEFGRQRAKIVAAMAAIGADAFGLMEIQNNGNTAAQNLVDALNERVGAGTYAVLPVPGQGTGTDAIRVAMIYKPSKLTPVGAPVSDTDPVNNRPTLAQTFAHKGERFTLFVNHLKSKSSCPAVTDPDAAGNIDAGDGQGCWNGARLRQAQRLRTFVAQMQAVSGSSNALLIGDFNAYAKEDPIQDLASSGYVDTVDRFDSFGYSYVFDGAAGRLDQAIASLAFSAKVSGTHHWHINADETLLEDYNLEFKAPATNCGGACPADPYRADAYRSSDHDPVVVGATLLAVPGSMDACKSDGWQSVFRRDESGFKNQGDCIQYVQTGR
ncbi:MAG: ExeM/NucH family extracellular endonuclease [Proteobacteria bacterium]|nr:ExeM/NucH family extracellular endonuclease [Pseudomonadota bacterium]